MKEIVIATKNKGKAKEFSQLFKNSNVAVSTLLDYPDLPEVEETGATFEENAIIKAETIANQIGKVVIADDSGLVVDALEGRPGIYSARYAGKVKDDEKNIDKVLFELQGVQDKERTARFYCALAVSAPNKATVTVAGTCEGRILTERRGTQGFGYDPIFYVSKKGKSMAELTAQEKNEISHRAVALKNLVNSPAARELIY